MESRFDLIACVILLFTALLLLCASPLAPFAFFYPKADTSAYLYVGRMLYNGFLPYAEVWDNKGPVLYGLIALGYTIGFGSIWGVWVIEILVFFLTAAALYRSLVRLSVSRLVALCSAVLLLFATEKLFKEGLSCEEVGNLCAAVSLYVLTWNAEKKDSFNMSWYWHWFQLFFIGLLFAAALLVRVNIVAMWLSFGSCVFVYFLLKGRIKELSIYMISFLLGAICLVLPVFLFFHFRSAFSDMLFAIWHSSNALATKLPYIRLTEGLKTFFQLPFYGYTIVICYFLVAVVRSIFLKKIEPYIIFVWLGITIFANSVSGYAMTQYTVSYVLIMCICFSYLCMWLMPVRFKNNEESFRSKAVVLIFTFFLLSTRIPDFSQKLIENMLRPGKEENPIATYIVKNTQKSDYVACVGFLPELYFLADRKSPSQYFYVLTNNAMNRENAVVIMGEFFYDIVTNNPEIIVETQFTRHFITQIWAGMENIDDYLQLVDKKYKNTFEHDGINVYERIE